MMLLYDRRFKYDNLIQRIDGIICDTEAGFEYPEFELDENINEIEKSVLAGGFSCQRVS